MGQAAWHHAQDQTSWHRSRRRRLPAQSYRLYPDPHSQTACRLATPRQGAPNTRLENYIQLHRAAPTTTGQNKTTLHFKVLQQTAREVGMRTGGAPSYAKRTELNTKSPLRHACQKKDFP